MLLAVVLFITFTVHTVCRMDIFAVCYVIVFSIKAFVHFPYKIFTFCVHLSLNIVQMAEWSSFISKVPVFFPSIMYVMCALVFHISLLMGWLFIGRSLDNSVCYTFCFRQGPGSRVFTSSPTAYNRSSKKKNSVLVSGFRQINKFNSSKCTTTSETIIIKSPLQNYNIQRLFCYCLLQCSGNIDHNSTFFFSFSIRTLHTPADTYCDTIY